MSDFISMYMEVTINEGMMDDFKALAAELKEGVANEPGTLLYEWFAAEEDNTVCVYERYQDNDALMAHMAGFAPHVPRLMTVLVPKKVVIMGNPNDMIKGMLGMLNPTYMTSLD